MTSCEPVRVWTQTFTGDLGQDANDLLMSAAVMAGQQAVIQAANLAGAEISGTFLTMYLVVGGTRIAMAPPDADGVINHVTFEDIYVEGQSISVETEGDDIGQNLPFSVTVTLF